MKAVGKKWTREVLRKAIPLSERLNIKKKDFYVNSQDAWLKLKEEGGAIIHLYFDVFEDEEEKNRYLMTALEQDIRSFKLMVSIFEDKPHFSEILREIATYVASRKPQYLLRIPGHFFELDEEALTLFNEDILLIAIQHDVTFAENLPPEIRSSKTAFTKKAIEINPAFIQYVHDVDVQMASKAFTSDNRVAEMLPEHIMSKVLQIQHEKLQEASEDSGDDQEEEPGEQHVVPVLPTPPTLSLQPTLQSSAAVAPSAPPAAPFSSPYQDPHLPPYLSPSLYAPEEPTFYPAAPVTSSYYPEVGKVSSSPLENPAGKQQQQQQQQTVQINNGNWSTTVTMTPASSAAAPATFYPAAPTSILEDHPPEDSRASSHRVHATEQHPTPPPPRPPRPTNTPKIRPLSRDSLVLATSNVAQPKVTGFKSNLNKHDVKLVKHVAREESKKVIHNVMEKMQQETEDDTLLHSNFEAWHKARAQRLKSTFC